MTDKQRLDWLGDQEGINLISDDAGRWAISTTGFQPVPPEGGFTEQVEIISVIHPEEWRPTIREAIDTAMKGD